MARALRHLSLLAALFVFLPIQAAEVTVVSSAFDEDNPFDLKIELGWVHTWHTAKITRETRRLDPELNTTGIVNVAELRYSRTINQLRPTLRAGLYQDLEMYLTWPYVLSEAQSWGRGDLPGQIEHSTLHNAAGLCATGRVDASCAEPLLAFTEAMGAVDSYRGGMDNGTVGVRWGIMSEERHAWSPTWVMGLGWTFPMSDQRAPNATSSTPGTISPVADAVNRWHIDTALSRRVGLMDPFIRFHYTLPLPRKNAFHNCDQASALADMDLSTPGVQNTCEGLVWSREGDNLGGIKPAHVGGIEFGTEILPYFAPEEFVRIALQLSAGIAYVSEGRDYTMLSDALGRLTHHDEHAHLHATVGLRAQASRFTKFHALFTAGYDTPYFLTREPIGIDRFDDLGEGQEGIVNVTYTNEDIRLEERNPNYDFRWDLPGRRFRAEESTHFTLLLMAELNF